MSATDLKFHFRLCTTSAASKNTTHFKSGQKWPKINICASLLKLHCDERFTHAFTACGSVFKVITLVGSNQGNYFENATTCSKRMRKMLVATQLKVKSYPLNIWQLKSIAWSINFSALHYRITNIWFSYIYWWLISLLNISTYQKSHVPHHSWST